MTFSIVACDMDEPAWGVAVASKFPAVGAVVPWAQAAAGAIATQSFANTSFGPRGLALLSSGLSAGETLARLLESDPEREHRQVGLVDAQGQSASFTGSGCFEWAGSLTGPGYAIQGNILRSSNVIAAMEQTFLQSPGDLPLRMQRALVAGDRAGGDRRGRQSAAIYIAKPGGGYGGFNDRWLDYRVDDHEDPIVRLGELIELHRLYFGKSAETDRVILEGENLRRVKRILRKLGYIDTSTTEEFDSLTQEALAEFIGNENFEERADPSAAWIDGPVLDYIYRKYED